MKKHASDDLQALCAAAGQKATQMQRGAAAAPRQSRRWLVWVTLMAGSALAALAIAAQWGDDETPVHTPAAATHARTVSTPPAAPIDVSAAPDVPTPAPPTEAPAAPAPPRAPLDPNAVEELISQPDGSC